MYDVFSLPVDDSFQAFLVDGAEFTAKENYPIIESSMVSSEIPKKIIPFNKALNISNLEDYFICFYAPDKSFERIRRNPRKYIHMFSKRCAGIIGFDFSVHSDMPIIKQKSQMNDNLSLTYYYGKNGALIIPNIRYGIDALSDEFLDALPKKTLIAVGTHGFSKTIVQKAEWFCFLKKVIKRLEPSGVIVYGTLSGPFFERIKVKTPFYYYEPWINQDRERRKNRGN